MAILNPQPAKAKCSRGTIEAVQNIGSDRISQDLFNRGAVLFCEGVTYILVTVLKNLRPLSGRHFRAAQEGLHQPVNQLPVVGLLAFGESSLGDKGRRSPMVTPFHGRGHRRGARSFMDAREAL